MFGNIKTVTTFALQINTNTYKMSKPTSIRIPEELKKEVIKKAKKEGRTFNGHLVYILNKFGK